MHYLTLNILAFCQQSRRSLGVSLVPVVHKVPGFESRAGRSIFIAVSERFCRQKKNQKYREFPLFEPSIPHFDPPQNYCFFNVLYFLSDFHYGIVILAIAIANIGR